MAMCQGNHFLLTQSTDWIEIPESLLLPSSGNPIHTITSTVYPDFAQRFHNVSYLTERSIITPTNAMSTEINSHMLALIPGMPRHIFLVVTVFIQMQVIQTDSKLNIPLNSLIPCPSMAALNIRLISRYLLQLCC
ncbi:unnamed protein product [Linum tenue]|uniref:ATP-dependent DNA helicase n=1 Tax=Linum tenue TaxID=586396 RepID=A0AAV0QEM8_9ROSI|nr:unnamed protein product [Linum tenue]